ncbi:MAG TPA: DNA methyltransferase [Verrucomicrobiae bacterium]|jgi:site-specific DNA-methyltransferase (adenine-specific)
MAHQSEDCHRLLKAENTVLTLEGLRKVSHTSLPGVFFFHLPSGRTDEDAANSQNAFGALSEFVSELHNESTICILTTPADAARLLPNLEFILKFQLWISIKLEEGVYAPRPNFLPQRHAALLIFTRYKGGLRHTLTRVAYTYCPACNKTTKDYGGKKHIYNPYGTLLSDVWRDIACDPRETVPTITDRLRDLFGIQPYTKLCIVDLRFCRELKPTRHEEEIKEDSLPFKWDSKRTPPNSRLINDDCLVALRGMAEASLDFCFADPPYNIQKQYDHWNDALESRHYFDWCDQWLSELGRILKPGRTLAVINIPLWAVRHYQFLCSTLKFQSWICWDGLSFPVRKIMPANYAIICFSKGEPRELPGLNKHFISTLEHKQMLPQKEFFCIRSSCVAERRANGSYDRHEMDDLWTDIHRLKHNSRRVDHPCQLPPILMRRLFSLFTIPGETILDCFNGAGTSTLVAQQMGRRSIGIELSPKYHAIATARHETLADGADPFGKNDNAPGAKNSRVERLPKQKYVVSKKILQLEVRHIAQRIGHVPNRDEVKSLSKYPIEYFDKYFISWGEVCAAARHSGMSEQRCKPIEEPLQPVLF